MKVLISGAAGYLGSILTSYLVRHKDRYEVVAVDNFMRRVPSLMEVCHYHNFEILREDARDLAMQRKFLETFDVIVWLAAVVGAPACNLDLYGASTTNYSAVSDLIHNTSPRQWILYPCTNSGYGTGGGRRLCSEDDPLEPISHYGRTKVDAEGMLLERENTISLRLATLFGMSPRMRIDLLINDFVYRALKDGALVVYEGGYVRNAVHVRDAARAFIHALDHFDIMRGEAYNVGLPEANISKLELCSRIKVHLPDFAYLEAPFKVDPDRRNFALDVTKLMATNFHFKYSLDDGIRELIKGYQMIENRRFCNVV